MENIEIPDDFYINGDWLCHKSCLYVNSAFSNPRRIYTYGLTDNNDIDKLRYICNLCDKIEENTHFVDGKFNNLGIGIYYDDKIVILDDNENEFGSLDEFLQYLRENIPECITNVDIKIALKD